ncbi:MAG TPA: DUF4157 domain-containing protein [Frankiaceae bacterium]|nr:DUF4157 domain-containing protein [Frankiaceae bacterium]
MANVLTAECGCKGACDEKKAGAHAPRATVPVPDLGFFERRLGGDFGGVRVATDSALATAMGARAVARGDRIDVAPGQWQPGTAAGRHLIAHELTHVLQQRGGGTAAPGAAHESEADAAASAALDGRPVPRSLLRSARGAPQRQAAGAGTPQPAPAPAAPAPAPAGPAAPAAAAAVCPAAVPARDAALAWLTAALPRLYRYQADLVIGGSPPDPHVAASVMAAFHTSDWLYVQVITSRLAHLAFALRSGLVQIDCAAPNDPHCGGATVAYAQSNRQYALVLCGTSVSDEATATVVHELAHTALPEVGIRRGRNEFGHVRDRAYRHDRLIRLLTPDEALDNAESYAMLVRLLNSPPGLDLVTAPQERPVRCPDDDMVRRAIARVERALTDADDTLAGFGAGLNPLPHPPLTTAGITDLAGVARAWTVYAAARGAMRGVPITCVANDRRCTGPNLGFGRDGIATTGATTAARQREEPPTGYLCASWFTQPEAVRDRSMLAVILLSHPGNMAGTAYTTATIDTWLDLTMALYDERTPAPAATDAARHVSRDLDTSGDPSIPRP